jgi:hypothetical protein
MQAKEAEDIPGDDDNLNNSVEDLIDPVKNSLTTMRMTLLTTIM